MSQPKSPPAYDSVTIELSKVSTEHETFINQLETRQIPNSNYVSDFKRKLHDPDRCCNCCNLWISSHLRLIFSLVTIMFLMYFVINIGVYKNKGKLVWMHYIHIVISIIEFTYCPLLLYGMYHCSTKIMCALYVHQFIELNWIMFMFSYWIFSISWLISEHDWQLWLIFVICLIILCSMLRFNKDADTIQNWAFYFKKGGVYDVNMVSPPKDNI
eukprot:236166_1